MIENNLLSIIIFAPLAGAIINWLIGGKLKNELFSGVVACGTIAISTIVAFYIALDDPWLLPSWDEFMLAKPFSRGLLRISRPLWVPKQADGEALTAFHSELQQMLDRTRISAEEMLARGEHRRLPLHHWTR